MNRQLPGYEFIDYIGSKLGETSFLYWAHKNKIPVIVPGIVDGAVGSQIWLFYQNHKDMFLDILKDQTKISDIIFEAKKTGALMLGGGISKHHTLWWNQFRDGLDYAVYITTANAWDGSLSGAEVKEAISWNKVKSDARASYYTWRNNDPFTIYIFMLFNNQKVFVRIKTHQYISQY